MSEQMPSVKSFLASLDREGLRDLSERALAELEERKKQGRTAIWEVTEDSWVIGRYKLDDYSSAINRITKFLSNKKDIELNIRIDKRWYPSEELESLLFDE